MTVGVPTHFFDAQGRRVKLPDTAAQVSFFGGDDVQLLREALVAVVTANTALAAENARLRTKQPAAAQEQPRSDNGADEKAIALLAWKIVRRAKTWGRGEPISEALRLVVTEAVKKARPTLHMSEVTTTVNELLHALAHPKRGRLKSPDLQAATAYRVLADKPSDTGYRGVRGRTKALLDATRPKV